MSGKTLTTLLVVLAWVVAGAGAVAGLIDLTQNLDSEYASGSDAISSFLASVFLVGLGFGVLQGLAALVSSKEDSA